MNKLIISIIALSALLTRKCTEGKCQTGIFEGVVTSDNQTVVSAESTTFVNENVSFTEADIPDGAIALINAYPQFIKCYENGKILFKDGTSMVYDDDREKDFQTMLDDSDLQDMFYVAYTEPDGSPEYLADAGRTRSEPLFLTSSL